MRLFTGFHHVYFSKPLKILLREYRKDPTLTLTVDILIKSGYKNPAYLLRFLEDSGFIKIHGYIADPDTSIELENKSFSYFEERLHSTWRMILAGFMLPVLVTLATYYILPSKQVQTICIPTEPISQSVQLSLPLQQSLLASQLSQIIYCPLLNQKSSLWLFLTPLLLSLLFL